MKLRRESDHLIQHYRERTSGPAPPELKEGVLKTLNKSLPAYSLFFLIAVTIIAASSSSALTLFITQSKMKHPEPPPPRFLQQETPHPLLSVP